MFLPDAKHQKIKNHILGKAYDLSFAFIDSETSHRLNLTYRDKDKPANVLSFPLAPNAGEILIDQDVVADDQEALRLFIHGLLHLKGLDHGSKMDREEQELIRLFSAPNEKHHHRPRYRKLRH